MRHPGLFLSTLLALGALPLSARSQEDLDREEAARRERVRADLVACGINPEDVLVSTGEARLLEVGRQVVALSNYHWQTVGERKPLADLLQLVAELKGAHRRLQAPVIHWSGMGKDVPGGVRSGKTLSFAAAYVREAHRAQVAPVLAAARAAEGPQTLQGLRWSMNYIERKGMRWNIQFGRVGEEHCAWLTNAATDVRMPRDAFERKHFDNKDPDFSGFDTRAELEAAIKKWAQNPERDRHAQREAKRARKAAKQRRGW